MAISLKVLAPNQNVYEGDAEEVILPSTTGQIGVLPGHIFSYGYRYWCLKIKNEFQMEIYSFNGWLC